MAWPIALGLRIASFSLGPFIRGGVHGARGEIAVRNSPQFNAILPQLFNDASIQKFHFPLRKNFPYLRCY